VTRAAIAAGALVAAALARPAAAYVRTTDPDTHVQVSWALPSVGYELSTAPSSPSPSCAPSSAGDPVEEAVRASFGAWNEADCGGGGPALRLLFGGRIPEIRTGLGGTAENVVVIRNGFCSQHPQARLDPCMTDPDVDCGGLYNCYEDNGPADRSTVALTTVLYDPDTGRLFDADMELNGWDGQPGALPTQASGTLHGYYFTCDTQPSRAACTTYGESGCNGYDLRNTITHEAGHFLGLAHPCGDQGTPACSMQIPAFETVPYEERTMYPNTTVGDLVKRTLSPDDVAGVCAAYPKASGGCGSAGGAGALVSLLALLALRPKVRR
jgi:hypothetical protein